VNKFFVQIGRGRYIGGKGKTKNTLTNKRGGVDAPQGMVRNAVESKIRVAERIKERSPIKKAIRTSEVVMRVEGKKGACAAKKKRKKVEISNMGLGRQGKKKGGPGQ